jgi:sirohydrochlorin cobaltochelatase
VTTGLILFAHGARDPRWADPLVRMRARLTARAPDIPVELAFLEIMTPDLDGAAAALAACGCTSITVVPIFLGQGGHVRRDLALLMQNLRDRHPQIEFRAAPAAGEDAGVVEALATYCLQMLRAEVKATAGVPGGESNDQ